MMILAALEVTCEKHFHYAHLTVKCIGGLEKLL